MDRRSLVKLLTENNVECRPIVTGNFLKNKTVLEYFDYEISGTLKNAEYLDMNGFFVGNHQTDITQQINYLSSIIKGI